MASSNTNKTTTTKGGNVFWFFRINGLRVFGRNPSYDESGNECGDEDSSVKKLTMRSIVKVGPKDTIAKIIAYVGKLFFRKIIGKYAKYGKVIIEVEDETTDCDCEEKCDCADNGTVKTVTKWIILSKASQLTPMIEDTTIDSLTQDGYVLDVDEEVENQSDDNDD